MPITKCSPRRARRTGRLCPRLEGLESRCLLSGAGTLSPDVLYHETLDAALDLKNIRRGARVTASGVIGAGPEGAADVNWFKFSLSDTAEVRLTAQDAATGRPLVAALSLYNDAPLTYDPATFSYIDPYTPDGHRLLAQDDPGVSDGPSRAATIDRLLAPGTYWVAVSGSGNDDFHPFLAGSGLNGRTGSYGLSITAGDPGAGYADAAAPVVLASDPAPGEVLGQSPFVLRFDLNVPIDPGTLAGYSNDPTTLAQLLFNTTPDFSPGGTATDVTQQYLAWGTVAQEPRANELQIDPLAPLTSGYYEIILPGYGPAGSDYVAQFQVAGPAGNTDPTQQPGTWTGTAYEIPGADDGRLHQVSGAIGVDPTDPNGFYQAGVELYHFSINHPGTYALDAEVFAGRIGSPLDASLTLYRMEQGTPVFVASNGNTDNTVPGTDGQAALYTDPALFETLGQGDYYLAVSATVNFPDPNNPADTTYFDPTVPQSGGTLTTGNTTGPFVLNLLVQPVVGAAPHVVAVTPDAGPDGTGPLAAVRVKFDRPVNLLSLAFERYQETAAAGATNGALESATLTAGGQSFDLRLGSYDDATNTATFILLDPVPPGEYTLTLSGDGPDGIESAAGVPLAGEVPGSHTFTTTIEVAGAANDGTVRESLPGFNDPDHAQPIGTLFPDELSAGVTISHDASAGVGVTEADYAIQLLQSRYYSITLGGDVAAGSILTVLGPGGVVEATYAYSSGDAPPFYLAAGSYTLRLTSPAGLTNFTIVLSDSGTPDNPTPLVVGSGPAVRLRLLTGAPDGGAPPAAVAPAGGAAPSASPAASSTGRLPAAFTMPSSALLAQGFSPLEGVAAAGGADYTGGDRLLAHAPAESSPANPLVSLVIVTQAPLAPSPGGEGSTAAAPPTGQAAAGLIGSAPAILTRVLDLMFEVWGLLNAAAPAGPGATVPPPPPTDAAGQGSLGVGVPGLASRAAQADAVPDTSWPWACVLAAGVMAAPLSRPATRAGRAGKLPPRLRRASA